jgi:hypothetical protein
MVQLLAPALDASVVGQFAQHGLEGGPIGILEAEGARDLARADMAGLCGHEGYQVVLRGEAALGMMTGHDIRPSGAAPHMGGIRRVG